MNATLGKSISKSAEQIDVGRSTIYKAIKEGWGPKITKIGRRSIIQTEDLQDWLRALRDGGVNNAQA